MTRAPQRSSRRRIRRQRSRSLARLASLEKGAIVFLGEIDSLQEAFDPAYCALLACPRCSTLGLITVLQFEGLVPVVCGSDDCSCQFRITGHSELQYLPAN